MKQWTNLTIFAPVLLLGVSTALPGQTPDWDKQTHRTVLSLKALPGQASALADFYRTGPGAKTVQARIKENPNLLAWTLLRNVYPGDTNVEVDHLIGVTIKGAPSEPNPALNAKVAREAAGMSYEDYMQKVRTMTTQVGQSFSQVDHSAIGAKLAEGDYVVVRRLKTRENQRQTLIDLVRDRMLPLVEDRVKAGAALKSWSFAHVIFPTGDSTPFDAADVRVYKDLASAVSAVGGTGGAAAESFARKFPGKSYTAYVDALRATTTVARIDVYRVIANYSK